MYHPIILLEYAHQRSLDLQRGAQNYRLIYDRKTESSVQIGLFERLSSVWNQIVRNLRIKQAVQAEERIASMDVSEQPC